MVHVSCSRLASVPADRAFLTELSVDIGGFATHVLTGLAEATLTDMSSLTNHLPIASTATNWHLIVNDMIIRMLTPSFRIDSKINSTQMNADDYSYLYYK